MSDSAAKGFKLPEVENRQVREPEEYPTFDKEAPQAGNKKLAGPKCIEQPQSPSYAASSYAAIS